MTSPAQDVIDVEAICRELEIEVKEADFHEEEDVTVRRKWLLLAIAALRREAEKAACVYEMLPFSPAPELEQELKEAREALAGLLRVCEATVVEDYPEYEIALVALSPTKAGTNGGGV